jgi:DNA-binding response OmpR family regulator
MSSLKRIFSRPDLQVDMAATAKDALDLIEQGTYDIILLDVHLPDQDGFELFMHLQSLPRSKDTPVIFLTGQDDVSDKVTAFTLGAEDYIVKPFNPLELRARIDAKLKRALSARHSENILALDALTLNSPQRKAFVLSEGKSKDIHLSHLEFSLLWHLAKSPDRIFSRDHLLNSIWGNDVYVADRTVDVHICGIRKKLGSLSQVIESVPGVGYRFSMNVLKKNREPQADPSPDSRKSHPLRQIADPMSSDRI